MYLTSSAGSPDLVPPNIANYVTFIKNLKPKVTFCIC